MCEVHAAFLVDTIGISDHVSIVFIPFTKINLSVHHRVPFVQSSNHSCIVQLMMQGNTRKDFHVSFYISVSL